MAAKIEQIQDQIAVRRAGIVTAIAVVSVVPAVFLASPSAPLHGEPECSSSMASAALDAATKQLDWAGLHDAFRRFKGCDDGAIGEGYSDIVAALLARRWDSLTQLAPLVAADPSFATLVLRHIDATANPDDLERIVAIARSSGRAAGLTAGFRGATRSQAEGGLRFLRTTERQRDQRN